MRLVLDARKVGEKQRGHREARKLGTRSKRDRDLRVFDRLPVCLTWFTRALLWYSGSPLAKEKHPSQRRPAHTFAYKPSLPATFVSEAVSVPCFVRNPQCGGPRVQNIGIRWPCLHPESLHQHWTLCEARVSPPLSCVAASRSCACFSCVDPQKDPNLFLPAIPPPLRFVLLLPRASLHHKPLLLHPKQIDLHPAPLPTCRCSTTSIVDHPYIRSFIFLQAIPLPPRF